jgi:hypothetical protein
LQIERHEITSMGLLEIATVSVASHAATVALIACGYPRDNSYSVDAGPGLYGAGVPAPRSLSRRPRRQVRALIITW